MNVPHQLTRALDLDQSHRQKLVRFWQQKPQLGLPFLDSAVSNALS
jgi:hypothetical protein